MRRTRVKICGLTRRQDVEAAIALGADAIGLVFYSGSPRVLTVQQAQSITSALQPFISVVGVFVDAPLEQIKHYATTIPLSLLQFHGDETPQFCRQFGLPYIKAQRMKEGSDLLECAQAYSDARALLLDCFHPQQYGGTGTSFDWSTIPPHMPLPIVLSGGLSAANVRSAIERVHPWAVDVSSGVESQPGIKDHAQIAAFIREVRATDTDV